MDFKAASTINNKMLRSAKKFKCVQIIAGSLLVSVILYCVYLGYLCYLGYLGYLGYFEQLQEFGVLKK